MIVSSSREQADGGSWFSDDIHVAFFENVAELLWYFYEENIIC
jgi:hypothetical protein